MLDADTLGDIQGEAVAVLEAHGFDTEEPVDMLDLCVALTNHRPELASMRQEGSISWVHGAPRAFLRRGLHPMRQGWILGHELGHLRRRELGIPKDPTEEAWCDAYGAALLAPRPAFRRAVKLFGHRVKKLAGAFATTQAVAMLRLGEVVGRPVALLRGAVVQVARGEPFVWPLGPSKAAHPIRLLDEGRMGLMAA